MTRVPYTLTGPIGARGTLGLIVLQEDETIEQDFRRFFPAGDIAVYASRIPSGADLTPETLSAMEAALPRAAGLFPSMLEFDAIAYACTSGATVIGTDRVAALILGAAKVRAVTDPLTATMAALSHVGARRIALVSPYVAEVSDSMRAVLARHSVETVTFASFEEQVEARVARIAPASIRDAAMRIGQGPEADAVFLSCTNLQTLDIIDDLEAALGKPVISSNQALAWHMARIAGIGAVPQGCGRLMATG